MVEDKDKMIKVTPKELEEMAIEGKEKQLTPAYYGRCADAVSRILLVLGPPISAFKRDLLLAQAKGRFEDVTGHEILLERMEVQYYQLKGLGKGLRLIVENQDPEPVIAELVSDIERIVDFKRTKEEEKK